MKTIKHAAKKKKLKATMWAIVKPCGTILTVGKMPKDEIIGRFICDRMQGYTEKQKGY